MNQFHESHLASVPVSVVSTHLVYCHYCQAWMAHVSSTTQWGDEAMEVRTSWTQAFGPFDDETQVTEYVVNALTGMLADPAAPWVSRLPR